MNNFHPITCKNKKIGSEYHEKENKEQETY